MQNFNREPSKLTQRTIKSFDRSNGSQINIDEFTKDVVTPIPKKRQSRFRLDLFLLWDLQVATWFLSSMSVLIFLAPFSTVKNYQPFKDIGIFSIAISSGYVVSKPIGAIRKHLRDKGRT